MASKNQPKAEESGYTKEYKDIFKISPEDKALIDEKSSGSFQIFTVFQDTPTKTVIQTAQID